MAPLAAHVQAFSVGEHAISVEVMTNLLHIAAAPYKDTPHVARALFEAASYDNVVREWWDRHIDAILAVMLQQAELDRAAGRLKRLDGLDLRITVYAIPGGCSTRRSTKNSSSTTASTTTP